MLGKIGPVELALIVCLVAVLWRPQRLSEFAHSIGEALREFRHSMND